MKNQIFDKSLISHIFITTKDFTLGESSGIFLMIKDANCWKKQHMLLKTTLVDEKTTHIAQNPWKSIHFYCPGRGTNTRGPTYIQTFKIEKMYHNKKIVAGNFLYHVSFWRYGLVCSDLLDRWGVEGEVRGQKKSKKCDFTNITFNRCCPEVKNI